MEKIMISKEEMAELKKQMNELSDEELDKVAGGLWCEPGCYPKLNGCYCEEDW